jgi:hypothetical protein
MAFEQVLFEPLPLHNVVKCKTDVNLTYTKDNVPHSGQKVC